MIRDNFYKFCGATKTRPLGFADVHGVASERSSCAAANWVRMRIRNNHGAAGACELIITKGAAYRAAGGSIRPCYYKGEHC